QVVRVVRDGDGVALLAGTRDEVDEEAARMAAEAVAAPLAAAGGEVSGLPATDAAEADAGEPAAV
ncbi:MAG TPA: hypothetical protein VFQ39_00810, partial [Longimicrobium sp.]|nr:hypothetical protein [Longimicrobium sp.]